MCDRQHPHGGAEQDEPEQVGELAGGRDVDEVPEDGAADECDGCLTHQEYTDPVFAWTWDMLAAVSFEDKQHFERHTFIVWNSCPIDKRSWHHWNNLHL
jgi:hypothetical protein